MKTRVTKIILLTALSLTWATPSRAITSCEMAVRYATAKTWGDRLKLALLPAKVIPRTPNWKEVHRLISRYRFGQPETIAWLKDLEARAKINAVSFEEVLAAGAVINPGRGTGSGSFKQLLETAEKQTGLKRLRVRENSRGPIALALRSSPTIVNRRTGMMDLGGILRVINFPQKVSDFEALMMSVIKELGPPKPSWMSVVRKAGWDYKSYRKIWLDEKAAWEEMRPQALEFFADLQTFALKPRTVSELQVLVKKYDLDKDVKALEEIQKLKTSSPEEFLASLRVGRAGQDNATFGERLWTVVKGGLLRLPLMALTINLYHNPESVQPQNIGEWHALLLLIFPKTLFNPTLVLGSNLWLAEGFLRWPFSKNVGDAFLGQENQVGKFTSQIMGYIENEALLSFCYLFGASRETCEHITYEDAPQETLRKSTNRTAQLTLLVPKDLLVSDDEAYDSLAEGLFNPVGSSLKECYPCDPDGSVYLGFQSELKAKNFDESAKKLRAKSLFNSKLMEEEACFRHIQEQYVSERKKLNPSEFADLPPPTEAYLKLTEKCKAAKQMRK